MAQKTLIIALGSTGMRIARDVLGRIEDEYGSLDRVPWVEAVVLETAQAGIDDPLLAGRVAHIGLPGARFTSAIASFANPSVRLAEWCDPDQLRRAQAAGTVDGAQNIRMNGRFTFLHPDTGNKVHPLIGTAVSRLAAVDALTASAALGQYPWGGTAKVAFSTNDGGGAQVAVYVCGTLAGGTCSGSFIDVGYYLKAAGFPGAVGMFLVPHQQINNDVLAANTYAALTELNHYHTTGTQYSAEFSALGRSATYEEPPYSSLFLIGPRSNDDAGYKNAIHSVGQFIYLQAVSDINAAVRGEMVNPGGVFKDSRDTEGNPLTYNSMGVSVIEYPAAHIVKGCSYRLLDNSLELWKSGAGLQDGAGAGLIADTAKGNGLNPSTLEEHLMQAGEGQTTSLDALLNAEIDRAVGGMRQNMSQVARGAEGAIKTGFDSSAPATDHPISPGLFVGTVQKNGAQQIADRRASVQATVRAALLDADRGLVWTKDYIKTLGSVAQREREALRLRADDLKARQSQAGLAIDAARSRVEESHRAGGLFPVFYRPTAVGITVAEYEAALRDSGHARLGTIVNDQLVRLWDQIALMSAAYAKRMDDPLYGLETASRRLQESFAAEAGAIDAEGPQANGIILFQPGVTIGQEYAPEIAKASAEDGRGFGAVTQGEAYAKRAVVAAWDAMASEFVAPKSFFDPPDVVDPRATGRALPAHYYASLLNAARGFFIGLMATDVKDHPQVRAQTNEMIDEALLASAASLDVVDADRSTLVRSGSNYTAPQFAFFAGSAAAPVNNPVGPAASHFVYSLSRHPGPFARKGDLSEPYRVAFVTGRAAFSLSMIEGLRPEGIATFRIAHDQRVQQDGRSYNSRVFLRGGWRPLESSVRDPGLGLTQGKLLASLAVDVATVSGLNGMTLRWGDLGQTLELGHDLEEAALEIRRRSEVVLGLDQKLKPWEGSPAEIADRFRRFLSGLPEADGQTNPANLALKVAGKPLTQERARELFKPYVNTIPGLKESLNIYRVPTRDDFLVTNPGGSSYYACPSCGQFLMSSSSTEPIPAVCPRCQTPLTI